MHRYIIKNHPQTAGFVGLVIPLVMRTPLLTLKRACVGISQVVQKSLRNNKQWIKGNTLTNMDLELKISGGEV